MACGLSDAAQHGLRPAEDVPVRYAQRPISPRREPGVAFPVPNAALAVRIPVDFYNKARAVTDEVGNERPDRHLTAETESAEPVST